MKKPKNMTDEQWGRFLAECAMGPLSEPPHPVIAIAAWVGLVLFLVVAWLSK